MRNTRIVGSLIVFIVPTIVIVTGLMLSHEQKFTDSFDRTYRLDNTSTMESSENPDWWLSSGGTFIVNEGLGHTLQGELSSDSRLFKSYMRPNADFGTHPQNIFRLVTRTKWYNLRQEVYVRILKIHPSSADDRNQSNGIFLFNRYADQDNIYYTGIRVDGAAVIKKKVHGTYYTMAYKAIIDGKYDRDKTPNLLPLNEWIGIRSEVHDMADHRVEIKFYVKFAEDQDWTLALSAIDDGQSYGGGSFLQAGHAGIRSDFMDLEIDNYAIIALP